MIEVLVAIVVVSLGMLGMAALHATSLRNTNSSYYRSIAVNLAADMADRIRANQLAQPFTSSTSPYSTDYNSPMSAPPQGASMASGVVCLESTAVCSASTMATYDYYHFWTEVHNILPNGVAVICLTNTPNETSPDPTASVQCNGNTDSRLLTIKIYWKDDKSNTAKWLLYSLVVRV